MKVNQIVKASSQVDKTLPLWIRSPDVVIAGDGITTYSQETHRNFVSFLTKSGEAQERVGFGQDLLQNLLKYRDFDFYTSEVIPYGHLAVDGMTGDADIVDRPLLEGDENPILSALPQGDAAQILAGYRIDRDLLMLDKNEVDMLELVDGYGFPDENGVILIDDEVILYRRKEGNKFYDLRRGSSAVVVLPSYREEGKYLSKTEPASHFAGSVVYNLSVLSLLSILDSIHNTYTHNITRDRVVPEVNRGIILKHIKDFFRSKGSKLGIKALFKILFGENDVDVFYPGDRMITPSKSTWAEGLIVRTSPIPKVFCNPEENYTTPDNTIGSSITLKSYSATITDADGEDTTFLEDDEFATSFVDYAISYQSGSETQYEIYINEHSLQGKFVTNPRTKLTRHLHRMGEANDNRRDVLTITVESTLGFPKKGIIFIDNEAIFYNRKTFNQFLDCHRGYIGVETEHKEGSYVYGPYYLETRITDKDNVEYVSRSWPLGLVEDIDIKDPGLLHTINDSVYINGPGRIDPADPLLCVLNYFDVKPVVTINPNYTFLENYDDDLTRQKSSDGSIGYVGDRTHGPDGVYYDDDYAFVSSSGFPSYPIGNFMIQDTPEDQLVGHLLIPDNFVGVFPRRKNIKENPYTSKGTDLIGTFVDGVRAYSQTSPIRKVQGRVASIDIVNPGQGYINPTVVLTPSLVEAKVDVYPTTGSIKSIQPLDDVVFYDNPIARISSGEGAELRPSFDRYGRIESVRIMNSGRYYKDVPTIRAIDESGKGKGAVFTAKVRNGRIISIIIHNHGIDYDKSLTKIVAISVGSGAEIKANVEYFEINRYIEVIDNPYWTFDDGNGFVYRPPLGIERQYYGYVCSPTLLREQLGDDGEHHSPLLGFAYDGNPIYGPYGFANNVDNKFGVERQLSGYILRPTRNNIIPGGGGTKTALLPPSTKDYPLGYFVQDYVFAPEVIKDIIDPGRPKQGYLATNEPRYLLTSLSKYIQVELGKNEDGEDIAGYAEVDSEGNLFVQGSILITGDLIDGPHNISGFGGTRVSYDIFGNIVVYGDVYVSGDSYSRSDNFPIETVEVLYKDPDGNIGIYGDLYVNRLIVVNYDPIKDEGEIIGDSEYDIFNKVLDENNGKMCNTPEYPKELYPDGVYCYFTTINDREEPEYPYIIGKTFNNRPISQRIDVVSSDIIAPLQREIYSSQIIDDFDLTFDFTRVERLRNPYLSSTREDIEIKIGEVSEGGIDGVHVQIPLPSSSAVGDYLYFDNSDTTGAGAQAVVSHIDGVDLISTSGQIIVSRITSHHQLITTDDTPTLFETGKLYIGGSLSKVERYTVNDQIANRVIVNVISPNLPDATVPSVDARDDEFIVNDIIPLPEDKDQQNLWISDTTHFEVGDQVKIETGYQYTQVDTHETTNILQVYNEGRIRVIRNKDARVIPDQTPITVYGKYLFNFHCGEGHNLNVGDKILIENSVHDELNNEHTVVAVDNLNIRFSIYTRNFYDNGGPCIRYSTSSSSVTGMPHHIKVTSPGYGYSSMPKILGTYHRPIDRAETYINMDGTSIGSVDVLSGGSRYVNPKVIFIDYSGFGSGAKGVVNHSEGVVTSIEVTDPGMNYADPALYIIEDDGKFICTTKDIGKIKSLRILNPGRNISSDRSLKPELMIDTKCVVKYNLGSFSFPLNIHVLNVRDDETLLEVDETPESVLGLAMGTVVEQREDGCGYDVIIDGGDAGGVFPNNLVLDGSTASDKTFQSYEDELTKQQNRTSRFYDDDLVYQGLPTNVTSVGRVIDYDRDRQIVTLEHVVGNLKSDELLYGPESNANVLVEGQSDCKIVVSGASLPEGKFIDDTSKLSESYAVIQDSYRYQWFSYVIASPIQQVDYETFVREIIHPAGFIQFADLTIHSAVNSKTKTGEGDLVTIIIDPCTPLRLLDAQGNPILSGTESGDKYILAKGQNCGDVIQSVPVLQLSIGPQGGRPVRTDEEGNLYILGDLFITGDLANQDHDVVGLDNYVTYDANGNLKVYGDMFVTGDVTLDPDIDQNEKGEKVSADYNGNIGIKGNLFIKGELVTDWDGNDDNVIIEDEEETLLHVTGEGETIYDILLRLNI